MDHEGISIKNAINYLGGFYSDLEQMWSVVEKHLSENRIVIHPSQGNKISYSYALSNDINRSSSWLLRNIQRYYLQEDPENKPNNIKTDTSLVLSVSLYGKSCFQIPVVIAGVIKYKNEVSVTDIWNYWLWSEICMVDTGKSDWRYFDRSTSKGPIYKLKTLSQRKTYNKIDVVSDVVDSLQVYFIDLLHLDNPDAVNTAISPAIELFQKNEEMQLPKNKIFINKLPEALISEWSR